MWAALQTFEKYLKYILLVNRVDARHVKHNITEGLKLARALPIGVHIRERGLKSFRHVAAYGEYRYLDISTVVAGHVLLEFDLAVWDLRRYCQVLDVFGKVLAEVDQRLLEAAQENLRLSDGRPRHTFRIPGGFLEQVLDKKGHPAREGLLWQNACYGSRKRSNVRIRNVMEAHNAPLYLFPEMLDDLLQYVHIPKDLQAGWRRHLEAIRAAPFAS
jgi:hypothetical protein